MSPALSGGRRERREPPIVLDPQQFPTEDSEIFLTGPAGKLECLIEIPEPELERPATAVICHPHPLHGGTLRNKVVTIIERALRESGLRTVRFNFRGAGDSEGEYDEGNGEIEDLLTVTDWVQKTRPADDLWLAGFSFGAFVALKAAQNLPVRQIVTIAPPVERYGFEHLLPPNCPWLVVQGDEDDVVSATAVQQWADALDQPPNLIIMEGADHFFHRRLMDLRGLIKNHVQSSLP